MNTRDELRSGRPLSVAIISDLVEEGWPSMDLASDMLIRELDNLGTDVSASRIRPPMRRRFSSDVEGGRSATADHSAMPLLHNADRVLNRFWDYPNLLRRCRHRFDVFHVVDHSYAQLVHHLPPERTVVTCHDLDTFRSLLEPSVEPRSRLYRSMVRRILGGLQKAALVVCVTHVVRDEMLAYGLVPDDRVLVSHNGVHPSCSPEPEPEADRAAEHLLGPSDARVVEILHVGSTIPRKRIDTLLRVFANFREVVPQARLIRVGGAFTAPQIEQMRHLAIGDAVAVLPPLERDVLAAVYRRATLLLLPSEREGFGLPIVEAMACGCPVIASDLSVLREVGGDVARYCGVGDVSGWSDAVLGLYRERERDPEMWRARRNAGIDHSSQYTWSRHAQRMVELYQRLA